MTINMHVRWDWIMEYNTWKQRTHQVWFSSVLPVDQLFYLLLCTQLRKSLRQSFLFSGNFPLLSAGKLVIAKPETFGTVFVYHFPARLILGKFSHLIGLDISGSLRKWACHLEAQKYKQTVNICKHKYLLKYAQINNNDYYFLLDYISIITTILNL